MKVAIVCDWLVVYGGAEKVLSDIITCFPDSDLFAVVDFFSDEDRKKIAGKRAKTTFIQRFPFAKSKYRSYLPFMPLAIEQVDLSSYDLIISSSHAVAKGVLTGPDQIHISYVHSPMRYAWDMQHQYLAETGYDKKLSGWLVRYLLHKIRLWDIRSANNVDYFIANSNFIARRIMKIYRRGSKVINPGIDLSSYIPKERKEDFYVTASRLVPYKRIDLIVDAFNINQKELKIIGNGPELKKLQLKAKNNIQFLGHQPQENLVRYLQEAKAFVFAAEEDFGILPIEAQSCGTPVLAYGKGGSLETIQGLDTENPTGIFYYSQTPKALNEAINQFETHQYSFYENCISNSKNFTKEKFMKDFKKTVEECITKMPL